MHAYYAHWVRCIRCTYELVLEHLRTAVWYLVSRINKRFGLEVGLQTPQKRTVTRTIKAKQCLTKQKKETK